PRTGRPFGTRRALIAGADPATTWAAVERVARYPSWWRWLRYRDEPGPLAAGAVVRAVIRPPLPYRLRFRITVDEVVPCRHITATVDGDLTGPAGVRFLDHPQGTRVELDWELRARRPLLRGLAVVARPVLEWGHDWVIETGVAEFERVTGLPARWAAR